MKKLALFSIFFIMIFAVACSSSTPSTGYGNTASNNDQDKPSSGQGDTGKPGGGDSGDSGDSGNNQNPGDSGDSGSTDTGDNTDTGNNTDTGDTGEGNGGAACTHDGDCQSGEICTNQKCVPGCKSNSDCSAFTGTTCNTDLSRCVNTTYKSDPNATSGTCAIGSCNTCCYAGPGLRSVKCASKKEAIYCGMCPQGEVFMPKDKECVPAACNPSADKCQDLNGDAGTFTCNSSTFVCASSNVSGYMFNASTCVPAGEKCSESSVCCSGQPCIQGYCY